MNTTLLLAAVLMTTAADDASTSWTSFRNGGASIAAGGSLPTKWSSESGVAWQRELPGYGQSTPIVWRDTVYVAAVEGPAKEQGLLLALNARDGVERWRASTTCSSGLPSNYMAARAAPTPTVDEQGVYCFFEGGDVISVAHDGKQRWHRSLVKDYGAFDNHHGLGSSPAQTADSLLINIQHRGPSYLVCLNKETGQTRWKVERKSTMAWSTPIVVTRGEQSLVVVSAGGEADAYDGATGRKIWSLGELSGNATPSPVFDGEQLYLGAALSDFETATNVSRSNICLKWTDGRFDVAWRANRALCDYASPVICGDWIYYINRVGIVYCLDRRSGDELYTHRLPSPCWATPIVQGRHVYFFGKNGVTTVIEAGAKWTEVAQNDLWDVDNPPKPETYVEAPGGHAHGGPPNATAPGEGNTAKGAPAQRGGPGGPGGFAGLLLASDKNQDGKVDATEIPESMKRMLTTGDKNQDGALDATEIAKLGEEFRKRREGMQDQSRDPIVYGAAAAGDALFVRTGTRIYCIRSDAKVATNP